MYCCRKIHFAVLIHVATLLIFSAAAHAKPQITVSLDAVREVVEIRNGVKSIRTVTAGTAVSGDTIAYTITYSNNGDEPARNAIIDNPIAPGMSYVDNSAVGRNAEVSFSIDSGKSYKNPSLLTYEVTLPGGESEKLTARPEEYTHIRWVIKSVEPGSTGTVSFKSRIK